MAPASKTSTVLLKDDQLNMEKSLLNQRLITKEKQNENFYPNVDVIKETAAKKKKQTCDVNNNDISKDERKEYKCFFGTFQTTLKYPNIIGLAVLHFMAVYSCITHDFINKPEIVLYDVVVGGIGGFGITAGVHRYWTHRCFKAKTPLKIILLLCYSVAGQNSLKEWVRDHRVHHKYSETDADPHNSKRGFWFSHVGWLCMRKHPDVLKKGKTVDMSDITDDPLLAFHTRHWMWFKLLFAFVIPTVIPVFWWNETWITSIYANCFVRYTCLLNFTWSVNSFAHIWGNKPYQREIQPVENKFVSVVAMGEGYHNYHHTFPWDYRAAELGRMLNVTTLWLDFFAKIGWAYDLKMASPQLVEKTIKKHGDGTWNQPGY